MKMTKAALRIAVGFSVILFAFYFFPTEGFAELTNISTRGFVGTGDNVLISGFIINGTSPIEVLVRGRGPSLSGAPFFLRGTLSNPFLQIFPGNRL